MISSPGPDSEPLDGSEPIDQYEWPGWDHDDAGEVREPDDTDIAHMRFLNFFPVDDRHYDPETGHWTDPAMDDFARRWDPGRDQDSQLLAAVLFVRRWRLARRVTWPQPSPLEKLSETLSAAGDVPLPFFEVAGPRPVGYFAVELAGQQGEVADRVDKRIAVGGRLFRQEFADALDWFGAHLLGGPAPSWSGVRIEATGGSDDKTGLRHAPTVPASPFPCPETRRDSCRRS